MQYRLGLLVCLFCVLISGQQCVHELLEMECKSRGCQPVRVSLCTVTLSSPTDHFQHFLQESTEDLSKGIDLDSSSKIDYVGCVAKNKDYDYLPRCMEYIPTSELYSVQKGYGFTSGLWKSVDESLCNTCFTGICPQRFGNSVAVKFMILDILIFTAAALVIFGAANFSCLFCITWKLKQRKRMSCSGNNIEPSAPQLRITRERNGNISIIDTMNRRRLFLTPQQYEALYAQNHKS